MAIACNGYTACPSCGIGCNYECSSETTEWGECVEVPRGDLVVRPPLGGGGGRFPRGLRPSLGEGRPQMKMGSGGVTEGRPQMKMGSGGVTEGRPQMKMGSGAMGRPPSGYANFTMPVFKQPIVPALVMGMVIGVGLFASYQLTKTLKV